MNNDAVQLCAHPDFQPTQSMRLTCSAVRERQMLRLSFRLDTDLSSVKFSTRKMSQRADGLWVTSCFEAFVAFGARAAYREFNVAPSTEWAIYDFDSYRAGIQAADDEIGKIAQGHANKGPYWLDAVVPLPIAPTRLGLSAVIEETDGTKSYWALRHPPGPPDFHHPDCFALTLPPPKPA